MRTDSAPPRFESSRARRRVDRPPRRGRGVGDLAAIAPLEPPHRGAEPRPLIVRLARWLALAPRAEPERWVRGRIAFTAEDRFRLIDSDGRGYLFSLGHRSGVAAAELGRWRDAHQELYVGYTGSPDQGAVAQEILPAGPQPQA